jgi:hypothetical protein
MLTTFAVALVAALLGLAFCFVGYRFFLVMLPIFSFFAGFWFGAMAVNLLLGGGFLATVTGLVIGFIVGIIAAIFSYLFYIVGVTIVGGAIGGALASALMGAIGFDSGLILAIVVIVAALIAAGLTLLLNLQKYVIIILTAMGGAVLIVTGALLLFGQVTVQQLQAGENAIQAVFQGSWFWGIVWLVVTLAGAAVQIRTNQTYEFTKETYVENWG